MIIVDKLSFGFPNKALYQEVSFAIEEGQHCAFIGTSGSGKSTLIEMIIDTERYMYDGVIQKDDAYKIGFISQFLEQGATREVSVFEYIAEKFIAQQKKIDQIALEMETSESIDTLLDAYQLALDAFDAMGGDAYESEISKKLNLADLSKQRDIKISALSGGEFKLVQVIKEMMLKPDLLIMDEPDVFLDFENLNALVTLINAFKGTLLVITHNRFLLNHCFNKIIHLENKEIQEFDGSYIEYNFSLLQGKIELQELSMADDDEIARNEKLIDRLRFIATHNTEAARGKALKARVKVQERLEKRRVKAPFVAIKQPFIQLSMPEIIEETTVLNVQNYSVAFEDTLLKNVTFEIGSSDKVALIGANGTGKTTLMRAIYENISPEIQRMPDLEVAYLSQKQEEIFDPSLTLMETFFEMGFKTGSEIKNYLMTYGFDEGMAHQKIAALSGGEKNLLQLAIVASKKANLLLLDEPTSHLDTYSQLSLEKAIEDYKGALIMISHDYYTIVNTMDYVLLLENQTVRKLSIRKFRKMIYDHHFDKDYLELEQKKKAVETEIELALKAFDFENAKALSEILEALVEQLKPN